MKLVMETNGLFFFFLSGFSFPNIHWQPDSNREPLVSERKSLTSASLVFPARLDSSICREYLLASVILYSGNMLSRISEIMKITNKLFFCHTLYLQIQKRKKNVFITSAPRKHFGRWPKLTLGFDRRWKMWFSILQASMSNMERIP